MKITALKSYVTRVDNRPRVLVKIETDEGIIGWGECYNHGPDRALPPILEYMFEEIKGIDPRRIEFIVQKILQHARFPPGAMGLSALSGIDIALWDIAGKAANLPVYMLLGGPVRDRVEIYHGLGGIHGIAEAIERTHQLHEEHGFTAFKMHPFVGDMHAQRWGIVCGRAAELFARLRAETPAEWRFAFDGHARIYEPIQAVQLANALAPHDPLFFEEPLRPEHAPAWGELKRQITIPLATGESLYSRYEFLDLLANKGADIIQPDICVVGGLLEMRKIGTIADAHYVSVAPHNPMGPLATAAVLHFCAAQTNFKILEYKLAQDAPWAVDPYLPQNGYLELRPDRPGLGIEIDETALQQDRYVHWDRKLPIRPDGSTAFT